MSTAFRPACVRHRSFSCLLVAAGLAAGTAQAQTQHLTLDSHNAQSSLQAKSLLGTVNGQFAEVKGRLDYDLSDQTCRVDMTMPVQSLQVDSAMMRKLMLSSALLDADRYPSMRFQGHCAPEIKDGKVITRLVGELTLRGQTHPLSFTTEMIFNHNTLVKLRSRTVFDQRQWGVSTMLHTVHPMVSSSAVISLAEDAPNSTGTSSKTNQ